MEGMRYGTPTPQPVSAAEPRAETAADVLLPGVLQGL
jgi:hypothetical protein